MADYLQDTYSTNFDPASQNPRLFGGIRVLAGSTKSPSAFWTIDQRIAAVEGNPDGGKIIDKNGNEVLGGGGGGGFNPTITSPSAGEVIKYDGTVWRNQAEGGGGPPDSLTALIYLPGGPPPVERGVVVTTIADLVTAIANNPNVETVYMDDSSQSPIILDAELDCLNRVSLVGKTNKYTQITRQGGSNMARVVNPRGLYNIEFTHTAGSFGSVASSYVRFANPANFNPNTVAMANVRFDYALPPDANFLSAISSESSGTTLRLILSHVIFSYVGANSRPFLQQHSDGPVELTCCDSTHLLGDRGPGAADQIFTGDGAGRITYFGVDTTSRVPLVPQQAPNDTVLSLNEDATRNPDTLRLRDAPPPNALIYSSSLAFPTSLFTPTLQDLVNHLSYLQTNASITLTAGDDSATALQVLPGATTSTEVTVKSVASPTRFSYMALPPAGSPAALNPTYDALTGIVTMRNDSSVNLPQVRVSVCVPFRFEIQGNPDEYVSLRLLLKNGTGTEILGGTLTRVTREAVQPPPTPPRPAAYDQLQLSQVVVPGGMPAGDVWHLYVEGVNGTATANPLRVWLKDLTWTVEVFQGY